MKLEIGVWQFVRIMVDLEKRASRGKGPRPTAYDDWREAWDELDGRLTELSAKDQKDYADLMMNQDVVVQCRGAAQLKEVSDSVERIVGSMSSEIDRGGTRQRLKDLRFEVRELKDLRQDLLARAGAKTRRKPRPSRRMASGSAG